MSVRDPRCLRVISIRRSERLTHRIRAPGQPSPRDQMTSEASARPSSPTGKVHLRSI